MDGVNHLQVFYYRKTLGISPKYVQSCRYDSWIRLIESGRPIESIAMLYGVKPRSIKAALWKHRQYSFVEAKKKLNSSVAAKLELEMRKNPFSI